MVFEGWIYVYQDGRVIFLERKERSTCEDSWRVMDERDGMCLVAIVVQVVRCRSWLKDVSGAFERRIDEGLIGLCFVGLLRI